LRRDYPKVENMKFEFKPTPELRASAKHAEIALMLANEIVEKVLHEDVHDNANLVVGVMAALAENFAAMTIRDALDDVASAIRESTMH
jgi:hypothetical protein